MKMNKHGYTLIELLTVLALIAIIAGVGMIAYNGYITSASNRVYASYEDTMHAEAQMYFIDNPTLLPSRGETVRISLNALKMENIKNPRDEKDLCSNSYVDVIRQNDVNNVITMNYKVCLICNSYNSDGTNCKTYTN